MHLVLCKNAEALAKIRASMLVIKKEFISWSIFASKIWIFSNKHVLDAMQQHRQESGHLHLERLRDIVNSFSANDHNRAIE